MTYYKQGTNTIEKWLTSGTNRRVGFSLMLAAEAINEKKTDTNKYGLTDTQTILSRKLLAACLPSYASNVNLLTDQDKIDLAEYCIENHIDFDRIAQTILDKLVID